MADVLQFTTSDLKDLEATTNLWFDVNDTGATDEFSLVLDDKALEEITKQSQFNTNDLFMEHSSSSESSEDEITFRPYHSSPPSSPTVNVGSPASSSSDLSPLLDLTADLPPSTYDPKTFMELSGSSFMMFPVESIVVAEEQHVPEKEEEDPEDEEKETKGSKKPNRKRRRNQQVEPVEGFVELAEEQLLQFDSKQIETYIKQLNASKNVSHAELKELKRIRRLIKNREYAQSSRNKKKQHVEEVEKLLMDARNETAALQQKLSAMEMENKTLKYQLSKIGTAIKKDPEIMERIKRATNAGDTAVPAVKQTQSRSGPTNKKVTTAFSATLFVILFSFGLFVNFGGRPSDLSPLSCSAGLPNFVMPSFYHTGRTLKNPTMNADNQQPTLLDLYAPAFIHNVVSAYFPREVLEETQSELDALSLGKKPTPMYTAQVQPAVESQSSTIFVSPLVASAPVFEVNSQHNETTLVAANA